MTAFGSILIANRGEIALRVMRTAKALGYRTIAVYSKADADAPHVRFADDAALIGPPPAADSYLSIDRILAAAAETGAEAVHPGYGFLSENAGFARACHAAGLVFIGPSADAIVLMGNKAEAKRRMIDAGVPCVPGYEGKDQSDAVFANAADEIGFPVMIKAAAGGGGRGMRLVDSADQLADALARARREALNAFGSDELILERAIIRPRHVEVQIFGDRHGTVVHLGERDCSVQRRHQKVIEEAPCPVMNQELRDRMGAAAVEAARSIDYEGAGTVEFLLSAEGEFFFLEMNTRLQVEHPVTEMVTGHDLVALQIAVARGEPLGFEQEDVKLAGHAIEVRLYAENPGKGFLPSTGTVDLWSEPSGSGVRVDAGIRTGQEISPFYDPMLAKVIAWGETRDAARRKLIAALNRTVLFSVSNNRGFLVRALEAETFADGGATTAFIDEEFAAGTLHDAAPSVEQAAVAAVLHYCAERDAALANCVRVSQHLINWSSTGTLHTRYRYLAGECEFDLTVAPVDPCSYMVSHGEQKISIEGRGDRNDAIAWKVDGRGIRVDGFLAKGSALYLSVDGESVMFNRIAGSAGADVDVDDGSRIIAPMHGNLIEVLVAEGVKVSKGTKLAVLEAMKMQHEITAKTDGTVREAHCRPGTQVAADDLLFAIEIAEN